MRFSVLALESKINGITGKNKKEVKVAKKRFSIYDVTVIKKREMEKLGRRSKEFVLCVSQSPQGSLDSSDNPAASAHLPFCLHLLPLCSSLNPYVLLWATDSPSVSS